MSDLSSYRHDLDIAVERGDLDRLEAHELMAIKADEGLKDPLLTTAERDELKAAFDAAYGAALDGLADEWSAEALGDLPLTTERP